MDIVKLHNKAMELADRADSQIRIGNKGKAKELYAKAYKYENQASNLAVSEHVGEPSETVLMKSAAFLAFDAKLFEESERQAKLALSRNIPEDMGEEMKELLINIRAARRLRARRDPFINNEIWFSLAGGGKSQEKAPKDDVEDKVKIFTKMFLRSAERQKNTPYRLSGQPSKEIRKIYAYNHSIERKTNQVVIVRLDQTGTADGTLENQAQVSEILKDIATNLFLVNQGNLNVLYERINDPSYLENFVFLAKELAPDGDKVGYVKFAYIKEGKKKPVRLTRQKRDYDDIIRKVRSWNEDIKKCQGSKPTIKTIKGILP